MNDIVRISVGYHSGTLAETTDTRLDRTSDFDGALHRRHSVISIILFSLSLILNSFSGFGHLDIPSSRN